MASLMRVLRVQPWLNWAAFSLVFGVFLCGAPALHAESLFTSQTPALGDASDGVGYELGMRFQTLAPGQITALRYWKSPSDGGTHVGRIWSAAGTGTRAISSRAHSTFGRPSGRSCLICSLSGRSSWAGSRIRRCA